MLWWNKCDGRSTSCGHTWRYRRDARTHLVGRLSSIKIELIWNKMRKLMKNPHKVLPQVQSKNVVKCYWVLVSNKSPPVKTTLEVPRNQVKSIDLYQMIYISSLNLNIFLKNRAVIPFAGPNNPVALAMAAVPIMQMPPIRWHWSVRKFRLCRIWSPTCRCRTSPETIRTFRSSHYSMLTSA